jgi:hypothetical protein
MQTLKSGAQFVVALVSLDPYSRHRFRLSCAMPREMHPSQKAASRQCAA